MIYNLHPELAPFVGKHYTKAPLKVLFQGESHYLPADYNHKVGQEWYELEYSNIKNLKNDKIDRRTYL